MTTVLNTLSNFIPFTGYPYKGQHDPCPLCGETDTVELSRLDRRIKRLTTVGCPCCGLLRTDPMPTEDELVEYYRSSYRLDYQLAGDKPPRAHLTRSQRAAGKRFARLEPFTAPGKSFFDFGCGTGELVSLMDKAGLSALGLEPGSTYSEFAHQTYGADIISEPWRNADLGDRKFDIITTFHVFEHLRDPVQALTWLAGHLADDGLLVFEVPNIEPRPKGRKLFEDLHFAHVLNFSPMNVLALGAVCGLRSHPDYEGGGTHIGFCRAEPVSPQDIREPEAARALLDSFGDNSLLGHAFSFKWIGDAYGRVRREVRDTFKTGK